VISMGSCANLRLLPLFYSWCCGLYDRTDRPHVPGCPPTAEAAALRLLLLQKKIRRIRHHRAINAMKIIDIPFGAPTGRALSPRSTRATAACDLADPPVRRDPRPAGLVDYSPGYGADHWCQMPILLLREASSELILPTAPHVHADGM